MTIQTTFRAALLGMALALPAAKTSIGSEPERYRPPEISS
jgi:hypothetical protein